MDFKNLQVIGAFVPTTLTKRTITINYPSDPEDQASERITDTVDVWIRKRSSADFLEMVQAPDRDKAHIAILRCVCLEDGSEAFDSLERVKQMAEWLFIPLMVAVNEVNAFGLKNSQPRTSSGTSSPSSSAARSRKRRAGSPRKNAPVGSPTAPAAGH